MTAPISTMLKAAGLWAKTSAKGRPYLTGRLGGVKVLILENRDRAGEGEPSHFLFFVDGEKPRQAEAQPRQIHQRRAPHPRSTYLRHRPPTDEPGDPLPSDRVDDLWPEGAA